MSGISDHPDMIEAVINTALTGDNTLIASLATQGIYVWKLLLVVGGITNITFKNGVTPISGPMPLVANGSISLPYDGKPWLFATAGNALISNSSGTTIQQSGLLWYTKSPANLQP